MIDFDALSGGAAGPGGLGAEWRVVFYERWAARGVSQLGLALAEAPGAGHTVAAVADRKGMSPWIGKEVPGASGRGAGRRPGRADAGGSPHAAGSACDLLPGLRAGDNPRMPCTDASLGRRAPRRPSARSNLMTDLDEPDMHRSALRNAPEART